jgi:hypothetical protein
MNSAMFAVDRYELRTRCASDLLHHRTTCDQRLLIGQGESTTSCERGKRDRQASKPNDAVDDNLSIAGETWHGLGANTYIDTGERVDDRSRRRLIGDSDDGRSIGPRLFDEHLGLPTGGANGNQLERVWFCGEDIERLSTNGSRGTGKRDPNG